MQELIIELGKFSLIFANPPQGEGLKMYAEILSKKYTANQVKMAMVELIKTLKFYPAISEIVAQIDGQDKKQFRLSAEEVGTEATGLIFQAVRDHGRNYLRNAREELGPVIWKAVELFGGWEQICSMRDSDMNTGRAQLAKLCAIQMKKSDENFEIVYRQVIGGESIKQIMFTEESNNSEVLQMLIENPTM